MSVTLSQNLSLSAPDSNTRSNSLVCLEQLAKSAATVPATIACTRDFMDLAYLAEKITKIARDKTTIRHSVGSTNYRAVTG